MSVLLNNEKRKCVWKDHGINIRVERSIKDAVWGISQNGQLLPSLPRLRACPYVYMMNLSYVLKALFLAEKHGVGEAQLLNLCYK